MLLNPINPTIGVNLAPLKDTFDDKEGRLLDAMFRTLFNNLGNVQTTIAQVVNNNALQTYATANLPAASASRNDTMVIEYTGATHNLIYYAGGLRYRLAGVVF